MMRRWNKRILGLAILAGSLAAALPAEALMVQVDFQGTVASVGADVAGTFAVDDPVSGSVSYDTTVADSNPASDEGSYLPAVVSFDAMVGSYAISLTGSGGFNRVLVRDDFNQVGGPVDSFFADVRDNLSGAQVNGLDPFRLQFALSSDDTSILSSAALPLPAELLGFAASDGGSNLNFLSFGTGQPHGFVRWDLTQFTAVPEPSTALLLGGGLLVVASLRRRSFQP